MSVPVPATDYHRGWQDACNHSDHYRVDLQTRNTELVEENRRVRGALAGIAGVMSMMEADEGLSVTGNNALAEAFHALGVQRA